MTDARETFRLLPSVGSRRRRRLAGALWGCAVFFVAQAVFGMTQLEARFQDLLLRLGPVPETPVAIVLLAVDAESRERYGWPLGPAALERLCVVFDSLDARAVFFSSLPYRDEQAGRCLQARPFPVGLPRTSVYDPLSRQERLDPLPGDPALRELVIGLPKMPAEPDGVTRQLYPQPQVAGESVGSFAVGAARILGGPALATQEPSRLRFRGPPSHFPMLPLWRLLERDLPGGQLRERVWIVGLAQETTPTPLDTTTPMALLEVQAHALSSVLDGSLAQPPVWWALLLLVGGLAVLLAALLPGRGLLIQGIYQLGVFASGWSLLHTSSLLPPLLALSVLGLAVHAWQLGTRLLDYRRDLLELLVSEAQSSTLLTSSGSALQAWARVLRQLQKHTGVPELCVCSDSGQGSELRIVASLPAESIYQQHRLHAPESAGLLSGEALSPTLPEEHFVVRSMRRSGSRFYLLARPAGSPLARKERLYLESLVPLLTQAARDDSGQRSPQAVLASSFDTLRDRLADAERRRRSERLLLTRMLDRLDIGLAVSDGFGRVLLQNRFLAPLVDTRGGGAATIPRLLAQLTGRDEAAVELLLEPVYRGETSLVLPAGQQSSRQASLRIRVLPLSGGGASGPQWPEQLVVVVTDVAAHRRLDSIKSELLEAISYRIRNHVGGILCATELLASDPAMAGVLGPDMERSGKQLVEILEGFGESLALTIDTLDSDSQVPLNMSRLVDEVIGSLSAEIAARQTPIGIQTSHLVETVVADERSTRLAISGMLRLALSCQRPESRLSIAVGERQRQVEVSVMCLHSSLSAEVVQTALQEPADDGIPEDDGSLQSLARCAARLRKYGGQVRARAPRPELVVLELTLEKLA